ncbi:MAG: PIN domain-containing protein [Candidatus Omnitrophota bacterium]|nr:PIN domain-containing protein [Candidatus Omnitrophota bacterium]
MVLVDTSIWVSHFREGNSRLEALLQNAQVMRHDFIAGELACGNLKNRKEILSLLQALPCAPTVEPIELLHFIERQSLMGTGIGFVDAHLLASAQLAHLSLWTADAPLRRAAEKLRLSYHPA